MLLLGALISSSGSLGYLLPAIIGLESFGVPSPGETALITASVLASEGKLNIWLVLVIGISSAIIGDSIGYELGRRLGREVLTAKGPLQKERIRAIDAGERFFAKHGSKTVFFARWITGVRSAAAWLAGIDGMHYPTFLAFNAAGAITWGLCYGLVGYFGGQAAAEAIKTAGTYALIALVPIALIAFFWWRRRRRRHAQEEARLEEGAAAEDGAPAKEGARADEDAPSEEGARADEGPPAGPGAPAESGAPAEPGAATVGDPPQPRSVGGDGTEAG